MSNDLTAKMLNDRAAIKDIVVTFAAAMDHRNWPLLRSILMDTVYIDYSSFNPELIGDMRADDWVAMAKHLGAFTATQHNSANRLYSIYGDIAECVANVQNGHFLTRPDGDYSCFLYGFLTTGLVRTDKGWKISKSHLEVTARQGDMRVFEWAFGKG